MTLSTTQSLLVDRSHPIVGHCMCGCLSPNLEHVKNTCETWRDVFFTVRKSHGFSGPAIGGGDGIEHDIPVHRFEFLGMSTNRVLSFVWVHHLWTTLFRAMRGTHAMLMSSLNKKGTRALHLNRGSHAVIPFCQLTNMTYPV